MSEGDVESELRFPEMSDEDSLQNEFNKMFDLEGAVSEELAAAAAAAAGGEGVASNAEGDSGATAAEDAWAAGAQFAEKKKEQYKKEKRGAVKSTQSMLKCLIWYAV